MLLAAKAPVQFRCVQCGTVFTLIEKDPWRLVCEDCYNKGPLEKKLCNSCSKEFLVTRRQHNRIYCDDCGGGQRSHSNRRPIPLEAQEFFTPDGKPCMVCGSPSIYLGFPTAFPYCGKKCYAVLLSEKKRAMWHEEATWYLERKLAKIGRLINPHIELRREVTEHWRQPAPLFESYMSQKHGSNWTDKLTETLQLDSAIVWESKRKSEKEKGHWAFWPMYYPIPNFALSDMMEEIYKETKRECTRWIESCTGYYTPGGFALATAEDRGMPKVTF